MADPTPPAPARGLSASLGATLVIEALWRQGCEAFVICPGSRSTPLVAAIARHPRARAYVLHDERSAGFFALGMARARRAPAAVVTTSGTAVANLLPAAVEAARDDVPLWLLSADRPPEAQGTDANQTVPQEGFLRGTVRALLKLPPPEDMPDAPTLLAAVDEAVARSRMPAAGPLHINAMFRKPLEPVPVESDPSLAAVSDWLRGDAPYLAQASLVPALPAPLLAEVEARIRAAQRGLVALGNTQDPAEIAGATALAKALGWPLLACTLGNQGSLPTGDRATGAILHGALVARAGLLPPAPDLLFWCGGPLLSPELTDYLRGANSVLRIDPRGRPRAERPVSGTALALDPGALARVLSPALARAPAPISSLLAPWRAREDLAATLLGEVQAEARDSGATLSEPVLALDIAAASAGAEALFVGNSMPIRDIDLFVPPLGVPATLYANRGASGIDGLLSTAAGIAVTGRCTLALLGDVSLLHDAGALSALAHIRLPLVVVVVENGGGGIFDFLPIAAHEDLLERYFTTPHRSDIVALAQAHGVPARRVSQREHFRATLAEELATVAQARDPRLRVLVAHCPRADNVAIHRDLYRRLQQRWAEGPGGDGSDSLAGDAS